MNKPYYITYPTSVERKERESRRCEARRACFVVAVAALLAIAALTAFILWRIFRADERDERTAYLQGYYQVDRETAIAWANDGLGKSAAEVLQ